MKRMLLGLEPFEADINILLEGYQHYTPNVRTTQLGHGTEKRPELIDDKDLFNNFVFGKILSLFVEGPDFFPTNYTPTGPLRRGGGSHGHVPARRKQNSNRKLSHTYKKLADRPFGGQRRINQIADSDARGSIRHVYHQGLRNGQHVNNSPRNHAYPREEHVSRPRPLIETGGWKPLKSEK